MIFFHKHCQIWQCCSRCQIAEFNSQKVMYRGPCPCALLVVGEAPGDTEMALGKPFVGPAGKLLNMIIAEVLYDLQADIPIGYTNAICCGPVEESTLDLRAPTTEEVENCTDRLKEIIELANPWAILALGQTAKKAIARINTDALDIVVSHAIHPSAILRQGERGALDLRRLTETIKSTIIYCLEDEIVDG